MKSTRTKGIIIKNISGERYLLTSRRIVELDSGAAKEGEPWYATNKDIRATAKELPYGYIAISSGDVSVVVNFGKISDEITEDGFPEWAGCYRIGCGVFDFKTFKRILKNAGVLGTQKRAFAAKAGAQ